MIYTPAILFLNKYILFILECPNYKYGIDCSETCGHCLNNTTCQHTTGTCLEGCDDGYLKHDCKTRKWCDLYIQNAWLLNLQLCYLLKLYEGSHKQMPPFTVKLDFCVVIALMD